MRSESPDCRLADIRLAWCLETYFPFTASHMEVGDFSTPLRSTRNDIGGQDGQTVELCYRLWAVCFPREDLGQSDFRLALCLEMHPPHLRLVTGGREISGLYSVEMTGRRQGV